MGKDLAEIRRMPAKDWQELRRFYARCPFGPARGDMQAWLTAQHVWAGYHGKTKQLKDSLLWFGGKGKRERRKAKLPQRGMVGRQWVEGLKAAGLPVKMEKADGAV
jgi:hypothetical protein